MKSDDQPGWGRTEYTEGVIFSKAKDIDHKRMAKINNFASRMRTYIFNKYGYFPTNYPMTINHFEDFVNIWNEQLEVPGTKWTRQEMLLDEKKELAYICGCLYRNEHKDEFIEDNPLNTDDVVQFKAPHSQDLKKNRQAKNNKIQPGHYKVIAEDTMGHVTLQNIENERNKFTIPRRNIVSVKRHGLTEFAKKKAEINKEEIQTIPDSKVLAKAPFDLTKKEELANWIYDENQNNWMAIGFPGDWRTETKYKKLKDIASKLKDVESQHKIAIDTNPQRLKTRHAQKILKQFVEDNRTEQDISKTDGDERSMRIKIHKGRPPKDFGTPMMTRSREKELTEPMMTRARAKAKKKRI